MDKISILLKPRFEVIADYPNSEYQIGIVLTEETPGYFSYQKDGKNWTAKLKDVNYPHLFRKMNWWEGRSKEEMPKKVMSMADANGDTFEIQEWDMKLMIGWINKEDRTCCSLLTWKPEFGYIPVI